MGRGPVSAATDLIAEARRHRVVVARYGDTIKLRAPTSPPADLIARLRERKGELLAILPDLRRAQSEPARVVVNFRFPTDPPRAWATCLGAPGESRAKIIADLRAQWPSVEIEGDTGARIDPASQHNPRPDHDRTA